MKKTLAMATVLALALVIGAPTWAADGTSKVTFTKDVLPILQENCQVCHRPLGRNMSGMVAPMSLMSYKEVRPWAKAIARVTESREMPPWHASEANHGTFGNERTLSDEELNTILTWVKQGSVRGKASDAPEAVEFPEGWYMGEPDVVLSFPEPFLVEDDVEDLYHNVTIDLPADVFTEDKWIKQLEFMPGSEAVHHVIAYGTKTGEENEVLRRDHLGGLAPGTDPANYPEGYGKLLKADSQFMFAMHYHKESGPGTAMLDNTTVAIKFHDKPVEHRVSTSPIAYGPFEIPPFHSSWRVGAAKIIEEDMDLINLMPHTHLRGVAAKYTAFYPDGTVELLLDVPKYDFNWQTSYSFKEIKKIPAGTRIEWEIIYDNSEKNAERGGFNPGRPVSFGSPTTDEMDLGWMSFSPTEPNVEAGD